MLSKTSLFFLASEDAVTLAGTTVDELEEFEVKADAFCAVIVNGSSSPELRACGMITKHKVRMKT